MDVSKYLGNAFRRVGDVKVNGTIRVVIANVTEGKFDKPDLTFDDGTRLSLSVTNTRTLALAYGTEGADWIGKEIELSTSARPNTRASRRSRSSSSRSRRRSRRRCGGTGRHRRGESAGSRATISPFDYIAVTADRQWRLAR